MGVWCGWRGMLRRWRGGLEDLAATDFPAPWGAVSWALVVFTFEFGMGSGVVPPPWPPGRRNPHVGFNVGAHIGFDVGWGERFWRLAAPALSSTSGQPVCAE